MTFNLLAAFQRALNVVRKEFEEAYEAYGHDKEDPVKKAVFETYRSVLERLDCLI